ADVRAVFRAATDVTTTDLDRTAVRPDETEHDPDQRRLAAAVRTEHRRDPAAVELDVHVAQHGPSVERLGDIPHPDHIASRFMSGRSSARAAGVSNGPTRSAMSSMVTNSDPNSTSDGAFRSTSSENRRTGRNGTSP